MPAIGRAFHRDHTTVFYGVRKIDQLMRNDPVLAMLLVRLKEQIEAELAAYRARAAATLAGAPDARRTADEVVRGNGLTIEETCC